MSLTGKEIIQAHSAYHITAEEQTCSEECLQRQLTAG